MYLIEELSNYVVSVELSSISANVVKRAKEALVDTISAMCEGGKKQLAKDLEKLLEDCNREESYLFGQKKKKTMCHAAYINGAAAIIDDLDDVHEIAVAHPGSVIIPAVLAVAQKEHLDGKKVLEAIIVGYEAHVIVASASKKKCGFSGWYISTISGVFGVAAAIAKLLNYDLEMTKNAIGIASTMPCGNMQSHKEGATAHFLQTGICAENGIRAALLAGIGITGPVKGIEGDKSGFYDLYFKEYNMEGLTEKLHGEESILGVSIKPYASNRCTHSSITVVEDIMKEHSLCADDIESISISLTQAALNRVGHKELSDNPFQNKLCASYCVAAVLSGKKITPELFEEENLNSEEIKHKMELITISSDEEMIEQYGKATICPAKAEIKMKDGRTFCGMSIPKGSPDNFMKADELKEKFKHYTKQVLGEEASERFYEEIMNIEKCTDVNMMFESIFR